ncbi:hypothetical protein KC332_g12521 [Hortaea werneckii]|nr:hypothetical protein KC358_g17421 [Hortaea werneckii]KAI6794029.1 hypothetical protein KC350_g17260 [Hortaea werneckii]KAI6912751.1 hypothetical protein KC348_g12604 [Hortaea werneckii]KAI6927199.1 hypothetical protein KC341_g12287 [Hortaea werneckii]KAI6961158.1 hypothetical protein KC321_g12471 [Hortaea werneckii]
MPSFNTTVAWAVPVKVEVLGAHLEAYINLQPTINTLRMCHRFGKGNDVAITRLPVELLSEVEEYLVARERRKTRKAWNADFRCFQLKCQRKDHFTQSELDEVVQEYEEELEEHHRLYDCEGSCCDSEVDTEDEKDIDEEVGESAADDDEDEEVDDDAYDEMTNAMLRDYIDESYRYVHYDRRSGWCDRLGAPTSSSRGIFHEQAEFFLQHFGLETWTIHLHVSAPPDNSYTCYSRNNNPLGAETTLAYLKLPHRHQTLSGSCQNHEVHNGQIMTDVETGYAMRLGQPEVLTEKEASRFKRAVEILGLRPSLHRSQKAGWNSGNKNKEKWPVDMKPNLTYPFADHWQIGTSGREQSGLKVYWELNAFPQETLCDDDA